MEVLFFFLFKKKFLKEKTNYNKMMNYWSSLRRNYWSSFESALKKKL